LPFIAVRHQLWRGLYAKSAAALPPTPING
jgi:hypothetical protein